MRAKSNRIIVTKEAARAWCKTRRAASAVVTPATSNDFDPVHCHVADDRPVASGSEPQAAWSHVKFARVDTELADLETAFSGAYRQVESAKYAGRHLADVQYRCNGRFALQSIPVRLRRAT